MSFLDEIRKQPKHVREIMFGLCVVTVVSLMGMIWFRSFEEDLFVMLNPGQEEQERFYAERQQRTPTVYANITSVMGGLRATIYSALGFFNDYNLEKDIEEEYIGGGKELPLSESK